MSRPWTGLIAFFVLSLVGHVTTSHAQSLTITHWAGSLGGPGSVDGLAASARFDYPHGLAIDSRGTMYVADQDNHTIRKITSDGFVTTLAGLAGSPGSADGVGSVARFEGPSGVAVDNGGNVYVADEGNYTIRKITTSGVVTTLAGKAGSFGSADGVGNTARFGSPSAVAVDSAGNVYVGDSDNHVIRKITPAGVVTTFAGATGMFGDVDGTGSAARFAGPNGLALDRDGNLWVTDFIKDTIRRVTPSGVVTTIAGKSGSGGSADGTGSDARFSVPVGIAVDSSGLVYIADFGNNTIRKMTAGGVVTTLAGAADKCCSLDGTGSAARFSSPAGVAADADGNIYVADSDTHSIRRVTAGGVVTTFASAQLEGSADGTGSAARFYRPRAIANDAAGNLYVADDFNDTIRKVTANGIVTTLAGSAGNFGNADGAGSAARFAGPHGIAVGNNGNVYVADTFNAAVRVISPAGDVTTLVTGGSLLLPRGIAVDSSGTLYVSDSFYHTILRITSAGTVTTLAGTARSSGTADGTGSEARFNAPQGVAVDGAGNVYVADYGNHTIRKITPAGAVTTLAGSGRDLGSADGTGSEARFANPSGVAVDVSGNVYVADVENSAIRRITPAGVVTTVAGKADRSGSEDGTGAGAGFYLPTGVTIGANGTIYVVDWGNHAVLKGTTALPDVATIDAPTGVTGVPRQLSSSPKTATAWQWSLTRIPSDSTAALSAVGAAAPMFTPDKNDRYEFRLVARGSSSSSITTVSLTASCASIPVTPIISSNRNPSCAAQIVTLDAGPAYDSYAWSTGQTARTIEVAPSATTAYEVVGYAGSCPSAKASITQTVVVPPQAASISGFSPAAGSPGHAVTISGSGFTGATSVTFNGVAASFTISDDSHIATTVPNAARSGPIAVTKGGCVTTVSTASFVVQTPPRRRATRSG